MPTPLALIHLVRPSSNNNISHDILVVCYLLNILINSLTFTIIWFKIFKCRRLLFKLDSGLISILQLIYFFGFKLY